MEVIRCVEMVRGRIVITFESGWNVWLKNTQQPPFTLKEGTEVDRLSFEKYVSLHQYPEALEKAVSMLAKRPCSTKEIEKRLLMHHFDQEVVDLVLYKLKKESILDDFDFADQWVRSRIRKYGAVRIRQELRCKGVEEEIINAILVNISYEEQIEQATAFAARKMKSVRQDDDSRKAFQKITGMLIRRGYSWEIAKAACKRASELSYQEGE